MVKSFCEICMKNYASYRSLWNHNNKFHSNANNNEIYYYDSDKSNLGYNKNLITVDFIKVYKCQKNGQNIKN